MFVGQGARRGGRGGRGGRGIGPRSAPRGVASVRAHPRGAFACASASGAAVARALAPRRGGGRRSYPAPRWAVVDGVSGTA